MSITIQIPRILREYSQTHSEIAVAATTVRDALSELERNYPTLHRSVCDDTGAVRRHVNVFVNNDFLHDRNGLDTVLQPDDVIFIFPAVSGG